jgi:hypothetical protein
MQWQHYDTDGARNYFSEIPRIGVYMIDRGSEYEDWEVSFMAEGDDIAVEIGKAGKIYEAQELAEEHWRSITAPVGAEEIEDEDVYAPAGDPVMFPMTYITYNVFGRYALGDDDPMQVLLQRRGSAREIKVVDAYPSELKRLRETADDILDDPDSNAGEIRAAKALQQQLDDPNYQPPTQAVAHKRYYLNQLRRQRRR